MSFQFEASPSLGGLPTQILLVLFQTLPDFSSVRALAITNSVLHKTFIKHASSISFAVLSNEIPATILPEAIAAWSSSTVQNKMEVQKFLRAYHENREAQMRQSWTLSKASEVSTLYQGFQVLTSQFITSVLSKNPVTGSGVSDFRPPSFRETIRIERAYLRLEMLRQLFFSGKQLFSDIEQHDMYFKLYAPWENEQMGCLQDYWVREGSFKTQKFLHEGLNAHQGEDDEDESLTRFPLAGRQKIKNKPFFPDDDVGPEEAWRWAYETQGASLKYYAPELEDLRAWGYCFWDHDRLKEWDVLDRLIQVFQKSDGTFFLALDADEVIKILLRSIEAQ
jgi:hypothetical protein